MECYEERNIVYRLIRRGIYVSSQDLEKILIFYFICTKVRSDLKDNNRLTQLDGERHVTRAHVHGC